MVSFTTLVLAITAAASSVTAFKTPCNFPYDVCGWTLANDVYGYGYEELKAAHGGVDDGTLYNAVYGCRANGVIEYGNACPRGCQAGGVGNNNTPNANCLP